MLWCHYFFPNTSNTLQFQLVHLDYPQQVKNITKTVKHDVLWVIHVEGLKVDHELLVKLADDSPLDVRVTEETLIAHMTTMVDVMVKRVCKQLHNGIIHKCV